MKQNNALTLGILVLHYEQEGYYLTQLAKWSQNYNIELIVLKPGDVKANEMTVDGCKFDFQKQFWVKHTNLPMPDVIYDRCFYPDTNSYKNYQPVIRWLRKVIPFLGYGLPNKWEVQQCLEQHQEVLPFIIETKLISSLIDIESMLLRHPHVLFKPASGSQGKGIFVLTYQKGVYELKVQQGGEVIERTTKNKKGLYRWLEKQTLSSLYLCQPFLCLQYNENKPFDLRILIQKNLHGKWFEQGRAIRIGKINAVTSNLHQGGTAIDFNSWLETFTEQEQHLISKQINSLVHTVPAAVEACFGPLFEIGIDIAIDHYQKVWLLEVNSKPGRKILLADIHKQHRSDDLFRAPFEYIQFLQQKQSFTAYDYKSKGEDC